MQDMMILGAIGAVVAVAVLLGVMIAFARWYQKAAADEAIIRTGSGGQRVTIDGGILAIPVGGDHWQDLLVVTRRGDRFDTRSSGACVFVKLKGKEGWPES